MALLSLRNISRNFGQTPAVVDVSLEIDRGEFFGLLGPSGCGKTTTLRIIAGLESPDRGEVEFAGQNITTRPSEQRGFGMVFQNYALFPHLSVFENVAFGLRARGTSGAQVTERVMSTLELVQLSGFEQRRVDELSGGQQQRVAIARAIAIEPALLLFDEPLSNLDVALREQTRGELRELVKRLGLTAVYVTHDQEEAFALCDQIAVMSAGRIMQIGAPRELYEQPANITVAKFLGRNNLIRAMRLTSSNDSVTKFKTVDGGHTLVVQATHEQLMRLPVNNPCVLAIRPEAIDFAASGENVLRAVVSSAEYSGSKTRLTFDANGLALEVLVLDAGNLSIDNEVYLSLPPEKIKLLPER